MDALSVRRDDLVKILKENRDNHREIFLEAQVKYRERWIEELEQHLEDARDGKKINQAIGLPVPEDHTEDYNRVIRMLELCQDELVELSETDAAQYVMDDWAWKRAWHANTVSYTAGAAQ